LHNLLGGLTVEGIIVNPPLQLVRKAFIVGPRSVNHLSALPKLLRYYFGRGTGGFGALGDKAGLQISIHFIYI